MYLGPLVTVSMTPSFYDNEHLLLRAQLKCLAEQTCKDFDVWLIDPHYNKRKTVIPELAERFNLDIKHIPYTPNTRIAKYFDCAIFNAAFCYSRAPTNVRFSCYRFVRPAFIETILNAPEKANIDFYMHAVGPCMTEIARNVHTKDRTKHLSIWNFESEDVDWSRFPTKSGYTNPTGTEHDPENSLANWPPFMDEPTTSPVPVPGNVYGNIAWRRSNWMALNGTNEVITNAAHWEDLDFDIRANVAGQTVMRYPHLLYRLHHYYGSYAQRANIPVDTKFRPMCADCHGMIFCNRGDGDFGNILYTRLGNGQLKHYYQYRAWVCLTCSLSGAIYDGLGLDHYFFHLQDMKMSRAPVLPIERIGRNLSILSEHMDSCAYLSSKVEVFNDSWNHPYYYQE